MGVYQALMSQGDWSIRLRDDTPHSVRQSVATALSHIVVTPTPIDPTQFADADILTISRYVGVVLRPGPALELSGRGLAWWLGDDSGRGAVLESAVTFTAGTINDWVNGILSASPVSLALGSTGGSAGTLTHSVQWMTKRQALDTVVRYYFGLEWFVSNDFTVSANSVSNIFGATPTAVITPRASGIEGSLWGLNGRASVALDWEDYTTKVIAIGPDQRGSASSASPLYDGRGNVVVITQVVDAPDAASGSATTVAGNVLGPLDEPRYDYTLSTSVYDVAGKAAVGNRVYVYDAANGFVDVNNEVYWQGQTIWPVSTRILGMRWPIQKGMGVLWRHRDAGGVVYYDLTPYIEWEDGDATLEVGGQPRLINPGSPNLSGATTQAELNAWTTYSPTVGGMTLGNGTATGAFRRDGTSLHLRFTVTAGSTSANGAGAWTVSLPSGITSVSGPIQHMVGHFSDSSATQLWRLVGLVRSAATTVDFIYGDASGLSLAGGQPVTVGTGDVITATGVFEVQP